MGDLSLLADLSRGNQHEQLLKAGRAIARQLAEGRVGPWLPEAYPSPPVAPYGGQGDEVYGDAAAQWRREATQIRETNRSRLQCLLQSAWYLTQHDDDAGVELFGLVAARWGVPAGAEMPSSLVEVAQWAKRLTRMPRELERELSEFERGKRPHEFGGTL